MEGKRKPRLGCFEVKGSQHTYFITPLGLAHVQEMAALGSSPSEIAQYLRVSGEWMRKALDPDNEDYLPEVEEAYGEGQASWKLRLRNAQAALSETNAQMAIHLGKHHLGQRDDPVEHNHTVRVVGTLPDYGASSADWSRQFAPSALQSIDTPKPAMSNIVDAEIIEETE